MTHLDKKTITILVACTLIAGIIGGIVGSFVGSACGGYKNYGFGMMRGMHDDSYGTARGGMMGGQGRYNQMNQEGAQEQQAPTPAPTSN